MRREPAPAMRMISRVEGPVGAEPEPEPVSGARGDVDLPVTVGGSPPEASIVTGTSTEPAPGNAGAENRSVKLPPPGQ